MAASTRATDVGARRARAEHILDVASELLLRLGYRRVTIDDVADRAGIGKGTVYLHWRSREALFYAVIEREYLAALEELLVALRQDPEVALLHRMTSALFLHTMRRPLLRAAFIGDLELLGRLVRMADRAMEAQADAAFDGYLQLLHANGLLRADIDRRELSFAYGATVAGYFIQEEPAGERHRVPLERQAELLATTMRRTFEPEGSPPPGALQAVAPRVIDIYAEIAAIVRAHLALAYERDE